MEKPKDLDRLLSDLQSFLLILDWENLSFIAQAKKKLITELLSRLQDPPSDNAEYMTMSCINSTSGCSSWNDTATIPHNGAKTMESLECTFPLSSGKLQKEEQAVEESYEETGPVNPSAQSSTGNVDTDSRHHKLYGEEEDCMTDWAHYVQLTPHISMPTHSESQLCGFLWRKMWLGQWVKQLFFVRDHLLLCYRSAKDLQPLLKLDLHSCRVTCKTTCSRKVQHKVKITATTETLVIGFQSREQAEEWRKVIEARGILQQTPSSNNSLAPSTTDWRKNSHRSSSDEEKNCCLKLLQVQSVRHSNPNPDSKYTRTDAVNRDITDPDFVSGLLFHKIPNPDIYMDDSSLQLYTGSHPDLIYTTAEIFHSASLNSENQEISALKSPPAFLDNHYELLSNKSGPIHTTENLSECHIPATDPALSTGIEGGSAGQKPGALKMRLGECQPNYQTQGAVQSQEKGFQLSHKALALLERKEMKKRLDLTIDSKIFPKLEKVGWLDRACKMNTKLKAGSEMSLLAIGKSFKQTSTGTSSATSEVSFLLPILKRTASTKSNLKRTLSTDH
uniref:Actin filament-associated protein 1-like 2 isoform X2 n=1 Tax=Geotrypetes seraphini TaxID=260995 RepID=A0A6P8RKV7_GEOSA|nr:actin filament-associated protein 1-like 2 isoform X2 [Geotrypetes seraphini]